MKELHCDKLIFAIIQESDYRDIVSQLNRKGFYATVLHSTGGFLRRQSVTVMIGVNHERLEEVLDILRQHGERIEQRCEPAIPYGAPEEFMASSITVPVRCGGVVLFVLDVDKAIRY